MDGAIIQAILTAILGTGGIGSIIALWRSHKAKKAGAPTDEGVAVATSTGAAHDLNRYWQRELANVRRQAEQERRRYEARAVLDAQRIDALEEHIWLQRPPPPPGNPPAKEE